MKIALDIDGVLRNFCDRLIEVYKRDFPDHEVKPIDTWWFENSFPIGKDIYKYYVSHGEEIFLHAKPFDGAVEFVKSLQTLGHKIIIVTTQPKGQEWITFEWIEKHLPPVDAIMFTKHKYLADFDILLDDAPHNIEECIANDKCSVFFNQPWNEKILHSRVTSYQDFLEFIIDFEQIIKED